jgi:transcription antitermination factor NusG
MATTTYEYKEALAAAREATGEDAFSEAGPETRGDWFVLHTRSRQEKAVAADLMAMRIPHFLPLIQQVRYYGKRKFKVDAPLFPGYVFLRGSREQAFEVDRHKRIANIITVPNQGRIDWELRNIRLALENQAPLDPYPYLKKGVRVEVRSGPFRGLQGVIEDRTRDDRLILTVDMLGRAVSVELDGAILERID